MEEPYGLDPDRIAKLTDAQIVGMYGRERDAKTGRPKPVGVKANRDYRTPEESKAAFVSLVTALGGLTSDQAEAAWAKKTGG